MSSGLRTRSPSHPFEAALRGTGGWPPSSRSGSYNTVILAIAVAVSASYVETFGQVSTAVAEGVGAVGCAVVARRSAGHARLAWACFSAALAIWS